MDIAKSINQYKWSRIITGMSLLLVSAGFLFFMSFNIYEMQKHKESNSYEQYQVLDNGNNTVLDELISEDEFKGQFLWMAISSFTGFFILASGLRTPPKPIVSDEPIDWNLKKTLLEKWPSNVIWSDAKFDFYFIWIFTIPITLGAIYMLLRYLAGWYQDIMIMTGLLVVSSIALYYATKKTLEWRRFGETPLVMFSPGKIAGDVRGEFFVNIPYDNNANFLIMLRCRHTYKERNSKGELETKHDTIWEAQARVNPIFLGKSSIKLVLYFSIPENLPESSISDNDYHSWYIDIHGDMKGIDMQRTYEIPVIK